MKFMMNFRRYMPLMVLALASLAIAGCKDKEEATKEYLEGIIELGMPRYVGQGFVKQFKIDTLATIKAPDGSGVGYYFRNPVTDKSDTVMLNNGVYAPAYPDGVYTFNVGDEVGDGYLTLVAFSTSDYYTTSGKADYTVVNPAMDGTGSLTGFDRTEEETQFTDDRDGRKYWSKDFDGTQWMTQNLGWRGVGAPFYNSEVMANVLGQYYTWEDAQSACPDGWRLPTDEEVKDLAAKFGATEDDNGGLRGVAGAFMADLYFNGASLWPYWPNITITNESSMYMIPTGYAVVGDGRYEFSKMESYSLFWTSSEKNGRGVYRYLYEDQDVLMEGLGSKDSFAAPVRCIK